MSYSYSNDCRHSGKKSMTEGRHNLHFGHRHNTSNRHSPNARQVVTQHRVPLTVEVVPGSPLCHVKRTTRRYSRSEHVDHVGFQETFEATWGQRYMICLAKVNKFHNVFWHAFAHRGHDGVVQRLFGASVREPGRPARHSSNQFPQFPGSEWKDP